MIPRLRSEEHEWEVISGDPVAKADLIAQDAFFNPFPLTDEPSPVHCLASLWLASKVQFVLQGIERDIAVDSSF